MAIVVKEIINLTLASEKKYITRVYSRCSIYKKHFWLFELFGEN